MAITDATPHRAAFHAMTEGTAEDSSIIADHTTELAVGLPDRVLGHFRLLGGDSGGFAVDRLEHSLQTATRAHRADEDDEYVVCALLHDIGDTLGSYNHADLAAAILKPFVSEENHWMVEQHAIFQGYYFWHYLGGDRDAWDRFAGHPWYDRTASVLRASTTSSRSTRATTRSRSSTSSRRCASCSPGPAEASTRAARAPQAGGCLVWNVEKIAGPPPVSYSRARRSAELSMWTCGVIAPGIRRRSPASARPWRGSVRRQGPGWRRGTGT